VGTSNAIAEAGLSVVNVLKKFMTPEPIASPESIGLCMPQEPEDFQVTVWIYNFEEQKGGANATGFRPDPANPELERFAPMQIKLFMLVTAHSKAPSQIRSADEYRIIGRAMQVVRDMPIVEAEYLEGSLAGDNTALNLEMLKLTSDELTKIWNNASKPVKMSFGLSVTVPLESDLVRPMGARVSEAYIEFKQKD
jgi:hypothetical protein